MGFLIQWKVIQNNLGDQSDGISVDKSELGQASNNGVASAVSKNKGAFNPEKHTIVHGVDGPFWMDKNKWPKLKLSTEQELHGQEGLGVLTQDEKLDEENFMDLLSDQSKNSDMEGNCQGWQSPKTKKSKKKNRKVIVATRASSKVPRDSIPIATKAANRVMAKNSISGNNSVSNQFTLLNNTPTACLEKVIVDLDIEVDNMEQQRDVFRVEELARAAIAEANFKVFLEKQKERHGPHSSSQVEDLAMEAIDNKERGVMADQAKVGLDSNDQGSSLAVKSFIPPK